jgi:hypothetical protein
VRVRVGDTRGSDVAKKAKKGKTSRGRNPPSVET